MNKSAISLLVFLCLVLTLSASAFQPSSGSRPAYAADLLKVKLSSEAIQRAALPQGLYAEAASFGINELDQLMSLNGGSKVIRAHRRVKDTAWEARTGFNRWFLIKLDGRVSVEQALASFRANRYVEEAGYEYYAYTTAVPNDTFYANNWGHNNTAQLPVYQSGGHTGPGVGTIGYDVNMQAAWDQSQAYGSASIVIAIIDTGVDTAHPDLRLMAGYDYGDNDSNPMDDSADPGHGTACSGVAAGRANNALGVTGVAGGCTVMPLKIADSGGTMAFTYIENAITHAADYGAHVISMSLGAEGGAQEGSVPSTDATLEYAYAAGVVILAATANSNTSAIAYPSNHNKVISVGASSPTGQRKSDTSSDGEYWWGSNYGLATQDDPKAVDIMAPTILPATDITGTGNGYDTSSDYYMWFNGTSCATPYAAGVAALLLSKDPGLSPAEVRTAMVSTAIDMTIDGGAGWDRYTGYGMVDADAALLSLTPGLPTCQITAPANGATLDLNSNIQIDVTATDSDGSITGVAFYIDDALQYTDNSAPYSWTWDTSGSSGGVHFIKAIATDNSSNTRESEISITLLAPPDEGFESGNFTAYPWVNSSAVPWTVQSAEKYSGSYAARSGAIGDSQQTDLSVTLNVTGAGSISFFQKVSSESGYDYLRFFIDGVQQGQWSGAGSWTLQSYAVSAGSRTFLWRYYKDINTVGGSDCAWIDHIIFPPTGVFYAPPQNLSASAGNGFVNLSWQAPASGTPTGYKLYKDSVLLATLSGLSYTDSAVINGTTYSYYLIAVYSDGESAATTSVTATPSDQTTVSIGSGTSTTGTRDGCPININKASLHGQSVYTQAELSAAGITGPAVITQLGFYVNSAPNLALPNFVIRMKHTTAADVSSWQTSTGLVSVYSNSSYMPVAGGYHLLTLSNPFTWNGIDNILVDTAFSPVSSTSRSGTVRYSSITSGYLFVTGTTDVSNTFTGGSLTAYRPNIQLTFSAPIQAPFAQGFESGPGNWLFANGSQTNKWARGGAAFNTGDYGLYVSNDNGTSNAYSTGSTSIVHACSAVSFPSGTQSWKLRFNWKAQGEGSTDYLKVYLVDATTTLVAGTLLGSGQLGGTYNLSSAWQELTLDIPSGVNGQTKLLVFSWANNASAGTQPPAAIDDIRIVPGSQSDAAVVIDNSVTLVPPPVTDPSSNLINPELVITNISQTEGYALVYTGYNSIGAPYAEAGLDFVITGLDLAGSTITFSHNLGFVPAMLAYKVGDSGAWNIVNNPGDWTASTAWFTVPAAKAEGDIYAAFPNSGDGTLPVELSSFTATINAHNKVLLTWVTQSEDNCLGYHIFRNSSDALDSAIDLQNLVQATNTSQQQVYIFEDAELQEDGIWYYWLQSLDMDGSNAFFGPISIAYSGDGGNNNPGVPLVTKLLDAYPNPFNPSTTIRYSILTPGELSLEIFNTRGQKVKCFTVTHSQPGYYELNWDGKDSSGQQTASGVYLYRMSIGSYHSVKRMVLSK